MPSLVRSSKALNTLAVEKLASSGLTLAQGKVLGFYSVEGAGAMHPSFEARPALVLPYYDIDGRLTDFYRIRYLGKALADFAQVAGKKLLRYVQAPATPVLPYLSPDLDWRAIAKDPEIELIITEGELKAAKGCFEGFPTIGLGGVNSYQSKKQGVFFLPQLDVFNWTGRKVYITFDSDFRTNPNICIAINALAEELQARGALPHVAELPSIPDTQKTGLDDYLMFAGKRELVAVLNLAEPLHIAASLLAANTELVFIREPPLVAERRTHTLYTPANFTGSSRWATRSAVSRTLDAKGSVAYIQAELASTWMKWQCRAEVERMTYAPGQEVICNDAFNTWRGWGVTSRKGSVEPWNKLIDFLFQDAETGFKEWFLDWCAYPIQHPGVKMFSAVIVHGRVQGTGKSLLGYTLGDVYGKNFTKVTSKELHGSYNDWAENRQFILGDEISGSDKRAEADEIKAIITQEEISVSKKFMPRYVLPDCVNYLFTSNHGDAFYIEDTDRRFAVLEVKAEEALPLSFYEAYDKWRRSGDGPSAMFHYFLNRKISPTFNPRGPAFSTAARRNMAVLGRGDLQSWCVDLLENPDERLHLGQHRYLRDLFTAKELLAMYEVDTGQSGKVTANGISRAMTAAGAKLAHGGAKIKHNNMVARYFIVRNRALAKARLSELIKNLNRGTVRDADTSR